MSRILLVDDDPDMIWAIGQGLSKAGYEIVSAGDGVEALMSVGRHPPDMIVLDISMPRLDGLQVCASLRRDPQLGTIPILLLTGHNRVEDRVRGLEEGADDYLAKPFDMRELRARVQALLRRSSQPSLPPTTPAAKPDTISIGALCLKISSCEVSIGGRSIQLTPAELDLLRYLMSRPNEVFSSQHLLQQVWGYQPNTADAGLVRWHVMNLRAKIEADPAHPIYLRTVPRHGYIFRS